jgi:superfamily II RNA helicase
MSDEIKKLEERIEQLEKELAALKAQVNGQDQEPAWKKLAGSMRGDKFFLEIAREGQKIREADRKAARAAARAERKAEKAKAAKKRGS